MAPFYTFVLLVGFGLYAVLLLVQAVRGRRLRRVLLEAALLAAAALLLHLTAGFPAADHSQSFGGGVSPLTAIGIMFVCTVLGIAAHYVFYAREFSWQSMLKPIAVTPIVLLPLIGSVQSGVQVEELQMVSFAMLAFQNGFFWKAVLDQAKPVPQGSVSPTAAGA